MDLSRVQATRLSALGKTCRISYLLPETASNGLVLRDALQQELIRLERKFCPRQAHSIIHKINNRAGTGEWTTIDSECRGLLNYADALWRESQHQYDPTICILEDGGTACSADNTPENCMSRVDWSQLEVTETTARLNQCKMALDLNQGVTAYAVDCLVKVLKKHGVESALAELGQDTGTVGKQADGANWLIAIKQPCSNGSSAITRLKVNNGSLSIAGDFEGATEIDGEFFGSMLSPVDGQPIPGPLSVVVLADTALAARGACIIARTRSVQSALGWLENVGYSWMITDREFGCHGPLLEK